MKVLWFDYMEEVGCNGDDLILNPLFNFEPMKGLEHWGRCENVWQCELWHVQVHFEYFEGA